MTEYVIEFDGKRYEFPTWSEMIEFINEHKEKEPEPDTE